MCLLQTHKNVSVTLWFCLQCSCKKCR